MAMGWREILGLRDRRRRGGAGDGGDRYQEARQFHDRGYREAAATYPGDRAYPGDPPHRADRMRGRLAEREHSRAAQGGAGYGGDQHGDGGSLVRDPSNGGLRGGGPRGRGYRDLGGPAREGGRAFRAGDVDESPDPGPTSRAALSHGSTGWAAGPGGSPDQAAPAGPARTPAGEPAGGKPAAAAGTPAGQPGTGERPAAGEAAGTRASGEEAELSWRFPPQQVVASYDTHLWAARAVDYLAERGFPVERTAIVGRGLTSVETMGRMSWKDATLRTLGTGAVTGVLVGWIFGLLDWVNPWRAAFTLALWGLLIGAALGLFAGLLAQALAGGRRQRVTHSRAYRAESYDLLVDSELADRARSTLVLGGFPVTGAVRRDAVTTAAASARARSTGSGAAGPAPPDTAVEPGTVRRDERP
ncbi:hypothetical protein I6A81_34070 [Frankia sp. CN7]|nr:hypothetical protein [Frankia nepalensis]